MAGINYRKRGSKWEYRFEAAKINGKRKQISKGGFATKKEAIAAAVKAYDEYNNTGKTFSPSEVSVNDYLDFWVEKYCRVELKDTTTDGYIKKIKNHIKPEIGEYRLKNVDHTLLQDIINKKYDDGYSLNTLQGIRGILRVSFRYAYVNLHYISYDPAANLTIPTGRKAPKVPTRKKERESIPLENFEKILERFPEGHSCHLPLQIGYWTGLRIGEVFALTWDDIDFEKGTLSVKHQVQMDENVKLWQLSAPKYDGYRTIPIDTELLGLLKRTKELQEKGKKYYEDRYTHIYIDSEKHLNESGNGPEIDMVMKYENGKYIRPRVTQHLGRVVHYQLGMKTFDFHSLRHSHATMLVEAGVDPIVVQYRLGHKTIKTTLGTYTHITDYMQSSAVDKINALKSDAHTVHEEEKRGQSVDKTQF